VAPSESWASTRYAERPGTRFYVGARGQVPLLVTAPRGAGDRWVLGTWPLGTHDSRSTATLVISADSEVWLGALWAFEPPRRYDAVTAPYLPWGPDGAGGTSLPIVGEVILPLTAAVGQPRSVRLEYLAERGRRLSVTIGGRTEELAAAVSPTWRTVELPVEGSPPVLRLTQTRKLYPLVRWIELGPASQPRPPT